MTDDDHGVSDEPTTELADDVAKAGEPVAAGEQATGGEQATPGEPATAERPAKANGPVAEGPPTTGWAANADELALFLEEPNLCRVGTIDANGFAHVMPAWFHWDGEAFCVGADAADAKVANIRRIGSASIEIDSDVRRKRGILARGTAVIIDGDEGRARYEEISIPQVRRYVPNRVPREMAAKMASKGNPVVIEVRPGSIISWGR